ncbi:response regulator transcription factor [Spirosoma koreense]
MSVIKPALQHPEQIAYFAGASNYCWLYFQNGEKKLLAKPISYLESQLPDFIRIHKTVLINPACVKSLHQPARKKMAGQVCLDNGETFPVSRRRLTEVIERLQNHQSANQYAIRTTGATVLPDVPAVVPVSLPATTSIWLVTDNAEKAGLTKKLVRQNWPTYQFHSVQQSSALPELLRQLPKSDYPALLLLDATTATRERLNTLQKLKEDKAFGTIPVILLVLPTDQLVIDGYQQQANSVVAMPPEPIRFEQMIDRICRFWLQVVTLPRANR